MEGEIPIRRSQRESVIRLREETEARLNRRQQHLEEDLELSQIIAEGNNPDPENPNAMEIIEQVSHS